MFSSKKLDSDPTDPIQQYFLAKRFEIGYIVKQDEKEAARLYCLAADQGYAAAQCELASLYEESCGVEKDEKEAARLYKLAARQGHVTAQYNLALMYEAGRGVEQNEKKAIKLFRQAAEEGDASVQTHLALMYEEGRGIAKDEKEAIRLYLLAADQNNLYAQHNLAWMYAKGQGVKRDAKEAARLFSLAAEQGDADSQCYLALMYEYGRYGIDKDEKEAARLFKLAAKQDHAKAQSHLGWMYKEGRGVKKNEKKASELFLKVTKQIKTKSGKSLSLDDIKKSIDSDKSSWIPKTWPLPFDQTDYNCGLYALHNAVTRSLGDSAIPVTRKNGMKDIVSLRQMAKELKLTAHGAIYDVNAFKTLSDKLDIENCKVVNASKIESKEKYITIICDHLNQGYQLIAACDLAKGSEFPGESKGHQTHWAHIFGYYYSKGECYFLVAQYGRYFSWNAAELHQSNIGLPPKDNPVQSLYGYYKTGKVAHVVPLSTIPSGTHVRSLIGDNLTNFSCGLFGILNKNQGPGVPAEQESPKKFEK